MSNNKYAEKGKKEKVVTAIVCPISTVIICSPCSTTSCMWNNKGECKYKPESSELDLGEIKGFTISQSLAETRKAKSNIIKIIILDKYAHWVCSKYPDKEKRNLVLKEDEFVTSAFRQANLHQEVFKRISLYHFSVMCKYKTFKKFIAENPELKKNKLPSILGIREKTIEKVRKQCKLARKGKSKSETKEVCNAKS